MPIDALPYPGSDVDWRDLIILADHYSDAAQHLENLGVKGQPCSRAPFRLLAIQAIELYLSAALLHAGVATADIRAMQHKLDQRVTRLTELGMVFRRLTHDHLIKLTDGRDYLVARYAPNQLPTLCQINRLTATLREVATKVKRQTTTPLIQTPLTKAA